MNGLEKSFVTNIVKEVYSVKLLTDIDNTDINNTNDSNDNTNDNKKYFLSCPHISKSVSNKCYSMLNIYNKPYISELSEILEENIFYSVFNQYKNMYILFCPYCLKNNSYIYYVLRYKPRCYRKDCNNYVEIANYIGYGMEENLYNYVYCSKECKENEESKYSLSKLSELETVLCKYCNLM